jgi:hypothetical protein
MIKDIFILWVTLQLVVIGYVNTAIRNEILVGDYDCGLKTVDLYLGAILPLVYFQTRLELVDQYCEYITAEAI